MYLISQKEKNGYSGKKNFKDQPDTTTGSTVGALGTANHLGSRDTVYQNQIQYHIAILPLK